MKWKLAICAVAFAFVGLAVWRTQSREEAPPAQEPPKSDPVAHAVSKPPPPADVHGATLIGTVMRRGQGVSGVHILAREDAQVLESVSGSEGAFELTAVPPGTYWVSASRDEEASPLVGPVTLGPGERREGLVLELLAAGTVRGTVLDATTRGPLAGARVRSTGGAAVTDESGRFTLRGLPVGATWLEASAKRHLRRTEWLTLDAARELSGLEIFVQPASVVRGHVTRQGQAVAGAWVWAEPSALSAGRTTYGPATSSTDGTYELETAGGALHLAASAPGGARVQGPTLTLTDGESRAGVDVELGEGLEAMGVVRQAGVPLPGATLWVLDGKTQRPAASAATQAGGHFVVSGLSVGSYLVQVQRGPLVVQRGPFTVDGSGGEWNIDVDDNRTLTGTVLPAKAGVSVRFRSTEWAGPFAAETVTGADGRFRFEAVPSGTLWVEAQDDTGAARERATAGTDVTLTLVPGSMRGVVWDEAEHPVTDFTVRLLPTGGGPLRSYPVLSPTGDFKIEAPPGTYEVSAVAVGHGETTERPRVELRSGETFVKLRLQGALDLEGHVQDAQSHGPLAGAEVIVFRSPFGAGRWATVATRGDGTFHLSAAPKSGLFEVRKDGYRAVMAPVDRLSRGADGKTIEISLSPGSDDNSPLAKPYEGVGLQLDFNGGVRVASVFEGSPAQSAGVMPGDVIMAVDGASLIGLSPQQIIQHIMGTSGTVVTLNLQRGDDNFDVGVRRQNIQF